MGGAAGAALTAAAPGAAAARRVLPGGGKRGGGRPPVPDPRVAAPGSEAARQRQAIEEIKARRPAAPGHPMVPASSSSAPADPPPASPGGGPSLPSVSVPGSVQTGSGFLLGVFAWAVGLAYLRGGAPEVRQFFAAKFLNKTK